MEGGLGETLCRSCGLVLECRVQSNEKQLHSLLFPSHSNLSACSPERENKATCNISSYSAAEIKHYQEIKNKTKKEEQNHKDTYTHIQNKAGVRTTHPFLRNTAHGLSVHR